jgi:hypothetical protein
MGIAETSSFRRVSLTSVLVLGAWFSVLPNLAWAQNGHQGLNTVWQSTNGKIASAAFVDASAYTSNGDICGRLNYILSTAPNGVVIDARGVVPATGNLQLCGMNPWGNNISPTSATILLPAGTITICATWTLPVLTKIIGEGAGQGGTVGTTLRVGSSTNCGGNSFMGTAMIQMGNIPINCTKDNCFSVSVSDLALDGQSNPTIDGIDNTLAQELSSVQHVAMVNMGRVGLFNSSGNVGPYSDISIAVTSNAQACVETSGPPRGFHGLSCTCVQSNGSICTGSALNQNAGIYLGGLPTTGLAAGYATSIEDVYVDGFKYGIFVGESSPGTSAPAFDYLLSNINGGSDVTDLIHISSARSPSGFCPPQNPPFNVCDITIMGATSSGTNTIVDELSNTTLASSTDPSVGMYILGEQVTAGGSGVGNARFTTSPSIPSWIVGTTTPSTPCAIGDLYSITAGTTGTTLWGCVGAPPGPGTESWSPIL